MTIPERVYREWEKVREEMEEARKRKVSLREAMEVVLEEWREFRRERGEGR